MLAEILLVGEASRHCHGRGLDAPAAASTNAGVIVAFPDPASPIAGTATIQPAQVAALVDGMLYINVHTAANKDGEIRGQITKRPVTP